MSEDTSLEQTIEAIESELERLDAVDAENCSGGICVFAEDNFPRGWVCLRDEAVEVYGPAVEILRVLRAVEYGHDDCGWELAWDALTFPESVPKRWHTLGYWSTRSFFCALSQAIKFGWLYETREKALQSWKQ